MFKMQSTQRDMTGHTFEGLVEHSHSPLRCSACRAVLLDVMVVDPGFAFTARYRAECPHCPPDDKGRRSRSFPVSVRGRVCVGAETANYDGEDFLDDAAPGEDASILYRTSAR